MDAEEIIHRLRIELDKIYDKQAFSWNADDSNNDLFDGLEDIITDYYEELHPQGCGESLLIGNKTENKDFNLTREQIEIGLTKLVESGEPIGDDIIPGFLSSEGFKEEFNQKLIKTIKDGLNYF